jgi:hypothetical protein
MQYKEFFSDLFEAYPYGTYPYETSDAEQTPLPHGTQKRATQVSDLLEKNTPTSPDKWAKAKAAARSKFKVYPSAYANLWAAKKYKSMGGGWKKGKK